MGTSHFRSLPLAASPLCRYFSFFFSCFHFPIIVIFSSLPFVDFLLYPVLRTCNKVVAVNINAFCSDLHPEYAVLFWDLFTTNDNCLQGLIDNLSFNADMVPVFCAGDGAVQTYKLVPKYVAGIPDIIQPLFFERALRNLDYVSREAFLDQYFPNLLPVVALELDLFFFVFVAPRKLRFQLLHHVPD